MSCGCIYEHILHKSLGRCAIVSVNNGLCILRNAKSGFYGYGSAVAAIESYSKNDVLKRFTRCKVDCNVVVLRAVAGNLFVIYRISVNCNSKNFSYGNVNVVDKVGIKSYAVRSLEADSYCGGQGVNVISVCSAALLERILCAVSESYGVCSQGSCRACGHLKGEVIL